MILDHLQQAWRYAGLYPGFDAAFRFLERADLAALADGRYEIDGDRVYALVQRPAGRGLDAARLEAHRRYIDIQVVLAGYEVIGWSSLAVCAGAGEGYDAVQDVELFAGRPAVWTAVGGREFAVYFPEDAHAPLAGAGPLHKVVVKVAAGRP